MAVSDRAEFNARIAFTLILGAAYVGALLWAVYEGKLDIQSFIAGVGPSFGIMVKSWFNS